MCTCSSLQQKERIVKEFVQLQSHKNIGSWFGLLGQREEAVTPLLGRWHCEIVLEFLHHSTEAGGSLTASGRRDLRSQSPEELGSAKRGGSGPGLFLFLPSKNKLHTNSTTGAVK